MGNGGVFHEEGVMESLMKLVIKVNLISIVDMVANSVFFSHFCFCLFGMVYDEEVRSNLNS